MVNIFYPYMKRKNKYSNLIIIVLISSISTLLLNFFYTSKVQDQFIYTVKYLNISKKMDYNYEILAATVPFNFDSKFKYLANDIDLSFRNKTNDCSERLTAKDFKNFLVSHDEHIMKIEIIHEDVDTINECKKSIDEKVKNFNENTKKIFNGLFVSTDKFYPNYFDDTDFSSKDADAILETLEEKIEDYKTQKLPETINLFILKSMILSEKKKETEKAEFYTLKNKRAQLLNVLSNIEFISKDSERLNVDTRNHFAINLSIFIIIFSLLLTLLLSKNVILKSKKFVNLFSKLN